MRNGLIHSTGRERVAAKRVAGPQFVTYEEHQERLYCNRCDKGPCGPSQMWIADLCAQCHERKEKEKCVTGAVGLTNERGSLASTEKAASGSSRSTDGASSKVAPSSPLASDPTSAGWVKGETENGNIGYFKGNYFIQGLTFGWWSYVVATGRYVGLDGTPQNTAHYFPDWQSIDALLFPAREFAIGDTVECLPDEEFAMKYPHWSKHCSGNTFSINSTACEAGGFLVCSIQGTQCNWPVRALRLVKAGKDQGKC